MTAIEMTSAAPASSFGDVAQDELIGANEYDIWSDDDRVYDKARGWSAEDALTRWARDAVNRGDTMWVTAELIAPPYIRSEGGLYCVHHAGNGDIELRECSE